MKQLLETKNLVKASVLLIVGSATAIPVMKEGQAMALEIDARSKADSTLSTRIQRVETTTVTLRELVEALARLRCLDSTVSIRQLVDSKLPCETLTAGYWRSVKRVGDR